MLLELLTCSSNDWAAKRHWTRAWIGWQAFTLVSAHAIHLTFSKHHSTPVASAYLGVYRRPLGQGFATVLMAAWMKRARRKRGVRSMRSKQASLMAHVASGLVRHGRAKCVHLLCLRLLVARFLHSGMFISQRSSRGRCEALGHPEEEVYRAYHHAGAASNNHPLNCTKPVLQCRPLGHPQALQPREQMHVRCQPLRSGHCIHADPGERGRGITC